MGKYNINEGNQIGYMPTEFNSSGALVEQKLVADGALVAGQVVYVSGNMKVKATAAATAAVIGVAMFDAKDGEPVAVECEGLFELTASAAITAGALVESAAGGKVATIGGTPVKAIGIALNDATTDGDHVIVKFSI